MIHFDSETNVFHLFNRDISYVIHLNGFGRLETLYFGEKLNDLSDILKSRIVYPDNTYLDKKMSIMTPSPAYFYPESLQEISSHAQADKRDAPIIIQHENGSYLTDFEYVKHKIYHGIKPVDDLPSLDTPLDRKESLYNKENVDTLEILLKDITANVYLYAYISIYRDKDVIAKSFKIENKSKKKIRLLRAMSMQLDLPTSDYYFHHFSGAWARERQEEINLVHDGIEEIASNRGKSSHQENPFFFLSEERNNYNAGECIGFNLLYSGNWKMRLEKTMYGTLHLVYGLNDEDFCFVLGKNEVFQTPQAVISYSHEGIDRMSRTFHSLIKENIQTDKREAPRPLIFNSWEGTFFNFDTDSLIAYSNEAKKVGVNLFVLDDGWFGKRNNDSSSLGDWTVNSSKVDLHRFTKHLEEIGLDFGIWFEPEMISSDSELFREHPEYALGYNENKDWSTLERHQLLLDFSNDEVVDYIFQSISKILDEYPVKYVKWDHNRNMAEHFSSFLSAEKQGEVYHRNTLGYYKLLTKLRLKYPDILFEGCSGGGARFDLGTLYFVPQIWTSDETDGASRANIQYFTSLGYPLSCISSHVSASPQTSYKTKVDVALFGTYGYEMNPTTLNENDWKLLQKGSDIYHKYHNDAVMNGTLYHLANPLDHDEMSMISVSKDKKTAIAIFFEKSNYTWHLDYWKLKGLDPKKRYLAHLDDEEKGTFSGEYLMKVGFFLMDFFKRQNKTHLLLLTEANY